MALSTRAIREARRTSSIQKVEPPQQTSHAQAQETAEKSEEPTETPPTIERSFLPAAAFESAPPDRDLGHDHSHNHTVESQEKAEETLDRSEEEVADTSVSREMHFQQKIAKMSMDDLLNEPTTSTEQFATTPVGVSSRPVSPVGRTLSAVDIAEREENDDVDDVAFEAENDVSVLEQMSGVHQHERHLEIKTETRTETDTTAETSPVDVEFEGLPIRPAAMAENLHLDEFAEVEEEEGDADPGEHCGLPHAIEDGGESTETVVVAREEDQYRGRHDSLGIIHPPPTVVSHAVEVERDVVAEAEEAREAAAHAHDGSPGSESSDTTPYSQVTPDSHAIATRDEHHQEYVRVAEEEAPATAVRDQHLDPEAETIEAAHEQGHHTTGTAREYFRVAEAAAAAKESRHTTTETTTTTTQTTTTSHEHHTGVAQEYSREVTEEAAAATHDSYFPSTAERIAESTHAPEPAAATDTDADRGYLPEQQQEHQRECDGREPESVPPVEQPFLNPDNSHEHLHVTNPDVTPQEHLASSTTHHSESEVVHREQHLNPEPAPEPVPSRELHPGQDQEQEHEHAPSHTSEEFIDQEQKEEEEDITTVPVLVQPQDLEDIDTVPDDDADGHSFSTASERGSYSDINEPTSPTSPRSPTAIKAEEEDARDADFVLEQDERKLLRESIVLERSVDEAQSQGAGVIEAQGIQVRDMEVEMLERERKGVDGEEEEGEKGEQEEEEVPSEEVLSEEVLRGLTGADHEPHELMEGEQSIAEVEEEWEEQVQHGQREQEREGQQEEQRHHQELEEHYQQQDREVEQSREQAEDREHRLEQEHDAGQEQRDGLHEQEPPYQQHHAQQAQQQVQYQEWEHHEQEHHEYEHGHDQEKAASAPAEAESDAGAVVMEEEVNPDPEVESVQKEVLEHAIVQGFVDDPAGPAHDPLGRFELEEEAMRARGVLEPRASPQPGVVEEDGHEEEQYQGAEVDRYEEDSRPMGVEGVVEPPGTPFATPAAEPESETHHELDLEHHGTQHERGHDEPNQESVYEEEPESVSVPVEQLVKQQEEMELGRSEAHDFAEDAQDHDHDQDGHTTPIQQQPSVLDLDRHPLDLSHPEHPSHVGVALTHSDAVHMIHTPMGTGMEGAEGGDYEQPAHYFVNQHHIPHSTDEFYTPAEVPLRRYDHHQGHPEASYNPAAHADGANEYHEVPRDLDLERERARQVHEQVHEQEHYQVHGQAHEQVHEQTHEMAHHDFESHHSVPDVGEDVQDLDDTQPRYQLYERPYPPSDFAPTPMEASFHHVEHAHAHAAAAAHDDTTPEVIVTSQPDGDSPTIGRHDDHEHLDVATAEVHHVSHHGHELQHGHQHGHEQEDTEDDDEEAGEDLHQLERVPSHQDNVVVDHESPGPSADDFPAVPGQAVAYGDEHHHDMHHDHDMGSRGPEHYISHDANDNDEEDVDRGTFLDHEGNVQHFRRVREGEEGVRSESESEESSEEDFAGRDDQIVLHHLDAIAEEDDEEIEEIEDEHRQDKVGDGVERRDMAEVAVEGYAVHARVQVQVQVRTAENQQYQQYHVDTEHTPREDISRGREQVDSPKQVEEAMSDEDDDVRSIPADEPADETQPEGHVMGDHDDQPDDVHVYGAATHRLVRKQTDRTDYTEDSDVDGSTGPSEPERFHAEDDPRLSEEQPVLDDAPELRPGVHVAVGEQEHVSHEHHSDEHHSEEDQTESQQPAPAPGPEDDEYDPFRYSPPKKAAAEGYVPIALSPYPLIAACHPPFPLQP